MKREYDTGILQYKRLLKFHVSYGLTCKCSFAQSENFNVSQLTEMIYCKNFFTVKGNLGS